jgi:stress response protein YsnF
MSEQFRNAYPLTPTDSVEVVRSEEQLRVGTRSEVSGRVRLVKRVVTEERTVTVTLRHEELVVEHLPAGDADDAAAGTGGVTPVPVGADQAVPGTAAADAPTLELLLCDEEFEVVTRVVPRERVRVYVDQVTELVEVGEDLRREVLDVEGIDDPRTPVEGAGDGAGDGGRG